MEERSRNGALRYAKALEKAVADDDLAQAFDLLEILHSILMTPEFVESSRLLTIVNSARIKFVDESLRSRASELMTKWRKTTISSKVHSRSSELSQSRRKVVKILADTLQVGSTLSSAEVEEVAVDIEAAIDELHSSESSASAFAAKARTLAFNLKKNEALRSTVLNRTVTAHALVRFTPEELATEAVNATRNAAKKEDTSGRRSDWEKEHKAVIQEELGLAPTDGWVFTEDPLSDNDD